MKKTNSWIIVTILLIICFIFQLIGTIRYFLRIPDDFVGITLYSSACVFFGIATFGFYIKWKEEKENEKN